MDTHKPKTFSINDFKEWDNRGELVLQPRFQRRDVWSPKARSFLIDSIICGHPIPPIYLRQSIDTKTQKTVREVVDGQQRVKTILAFINNEFALLPIHNKRYGGQKFSELPDCVQMGFLEYDLSVDILIGATDADVLEVFARLNSYTIVLNDQEKLNAKWSGKFKQTVYKLGGDHLEFWRSNKILTDRTIVRMREAEFASELVVAMIDGLQDKKKSLGHFYKEYDDSFPQSEEVTQQFKACIDKIADIFGVALPESEFRKTTLFYSLFCVVYDFLYGLPKSSTKQRQINKASYDSTRNSLRELEEALRSKEPPREYFKFKDACTRHTTDLSARKIRHETILKEIIKCLA